MNLYLLRHGETEENKNRVYFGKLDVSLNQTGRLQAEGWKEFFQDITFGRVYVSERKRTKETAEIALGHRDIPLIEDNRINEIDFGEFEGRNHEEIKRLYPVEYESWNSNWKEFSPPGGESYVQFYNRIKNFMDEILQTDEEDVLITAHGGVIRSIYCYVLEGNMDFYWRFASKNGDLSIIKYEYGNLFIDSITHANAL